LAADFTSFNLTANPNGSTLTLASVNTTQILLTKTSLLSSLHVVVADDFITPVGPLLSVFNTVGVSSADPTSGTATATQSTFINTVNATGPAVATVTGFGTDSHASANPTFAPVPLPPPFTMKTDVSIAFVAPNFNGTIQSNSSALGAPNATIPEPASVLVWGGLMAVGLIGSIGRGRIRRFS
jgi:hypothetical protein